MAAPYATKSGAAKMSVVAAGSPTWTAAHDAAVAWAAADCPAFRDAAAAMGYDAVALTDSATGGLHWVLTDAAGRYDGVFVFRAPAERDAGRPLVIDSPHRGYDFTDGRAVAAYRALDAVALLQNTAHRCNLDDCSGCTAVSSYACVGCVRASDVVHSVDQLYYAVYDGLEQARDDLHFEYHGAAASAERPGCDGTAHLSQASSIKLAAEDDDDTYPNLVWRAFATRLGDGCACYHQRQSGCLLNGAASTAGRRTNREAAGDADTCAGGSTALAARFVHFEAHGVAVETVIDALAEAVPVGAASPRPPRSR